MTQESQPNKARGLRRLILPIASCSDCLPKGPRSAEHVVCWDDGKLTGRKPEKESKKPIRQSNQKHPTIPTIAPVRNYRVPSCRTVQLQPPPMSCKGQTDNCPWAFDPFFLICYVSRSVTVTPRETHEKERKGRDKSETLTQTKTVDEPHLRITAVLTAQPSGPASPLGRRFAGDEQPY